MLGSSEMACQQQTTRPNEKSADNRARRRYHFGGQIFFKIAGVISMAECVVLIRRFIKPQRVQDFLAWFKKQPVVTATGFLGKTLTAVDNTLDLPPGLNSFHIAGNPDCATFVMIERWASVADFKAYVPKASTADQDEFEIYPRQRTILTVM
jgi:quinol monooxygenase YgiN